MSLNTILATAPLTATGYHLKATGTALGQSLIWDNGTNVGIGNTNTSYTLDVSGTGRFTSTLLVSGLITGSSGATISGVGGANPLLLTNTDYNTGTSTGSSMRLRLGAASGNTYSDIQAIMTGGGTLGVLALNPSGGNVNINTTATRTSASGTNATLNIKGGIYFGDTNSESCTINNDDSMVFNIDANNSSTSNFFRFATNTTLETGGTELMRIKEDGAVILQSFSAASTSGNLLFNYSTATADSRSWRFANDTAEWGDISIQVSSSQTSTSYTTKFNISRQGNVGLSRTPVTNTLEVNGDASKTTAGSWLANSDINIKTDINTIEDALDRINKVRLVKFKYKDAYKEANNGIKDKYYHNVIAQEFQEIYPDYVYDSGDVFEEHKVLQVDTNPMYVDSVSAIQELSKMVIDLQNQINELKNK